MKPRRTGHTVAVLLCVIALATGCDRDAPRELELHGRAMGTSWSVRVIAPPSLAGRGTLDRSVRASISWVDERMSTYKPQSDVSRFNAAKADVWVNVAPETVQVVEAARTIWEQTGGALDPTVGALVNLWGFGPDGRRDSVPTDAEIETLQADVGMALVESRLEPPGVRKLRRGVTLDLSAVAKGFAVDRAANVLLAAGVDRFLVEIGGEIRVQGTNINALPWAIGVESPMAHGLPPRLLLESGAVATSGDYRNNFEANGQRYGHTIDPRTGRPVTHSLVAVTVVASTAMSADALATALMVLGGDAALALAEQENLAARFVVRRGSGFTELRSSAFDAYTNDKRVPQ